ncbi:hypothetical protein [Nocardioides sp. SYSU DS0651]|uniref:hypothetical protein n=1 Tax=Nocardioides sp. SYSU DS0651 TaxID=3415955 RepID=UPI003F4BEB65
MNVTEWRDALMETAFPDAMPLQEGQRVRQITGHDVRNVLGWLSTFADRGSGENAHPGVENLSKLTGMSDKHVRRCLKVALSTGWAVVTEKANGRRGHATVYALRIPASANHRPTNGAGGHEVEAPAHDAEPSAHRDDHRPTKGAGHVSPSTCPISPISTTDPPERKWSPEVEAVFAKGRDRS